MYRYVNAIFAHKLLVLLPLIVIPTLSVLGGLFLARSYEVSATIWIDSSPLLNLSESIRGLQSPNQVEADAFSEWLRTRSFMVELIERAELQQEIERGTWPKATILEEQVSTLPAVGPIIRDIAFRRSGDMEVVLDQTIAQLRKSLWVSTNGAHLVKITYSGDDPYLGVKLVTGAIDLFRERSTATKASESKSAQDFFQAQLAQQQRRLDASTQSLLSFKESHPEPPSKVRPPAEEQKLADLERQHSLDKTFYDTVRSNLEQARLAGAAEMQKRQDAFRIADSPRAPTMGGLDKKKLILFLVIGVMVGLSLGFGTVILMAWIDKTVRSREDLLGVVEAPVLAMIPRMETPSEGMVHGAKAHPVRQLMGGLIAHDLSRM